jgi:hypothetical protein
MIKWFPWVDTIAIGEVEGIGPHLLDDKGDLELVTVNNFTQPQQLLLAGKQQLWENPKVRSTQQFPTLSQCSLSHMTI